MRFTPRAPWLPPITTRYLSDSERPSPALEFAAGPPVQGAHGIADRLGAVQSGGARRRTGEDAVGQPGQEPIGNPGVAVGFVDGPHMFYCLGSTAILIFCGVSPAATPVDAVSRHNVVYITPSPGGFRQPYWPLYAANQLDQARGLSRHYSRMLPYLERQTRKMWGTGGIWIPETVLP